MVKLTWVLFLLCFELISSVKVINNGLAPPEIVHTPISTKREFLIYLITQNFIQCNTHMFLGSSKTSIFNFLRLICQD